MALPGEPLGPQTLVFMNIFNSHIKTKILMKKTQTISKTFLFLAEVVKSWYIDIIETIINPNRMGVGSLNGLQSKEKETNPHSK